MNGPAAIELFRDRLREPLKGSPLVDAEVLVTVKPLTPEEAIGNPLRRDFPIIEGKERVIEAIVLGARGQAYTGAPAGFSGRLGEVVDMALGSSRERAIFLAAANAAMCHLGLARGTVHCRDEDPEGCAAEISDKAKATGADRVGLVGLNPAIAESLIDGFGPGNVCLADLNPATIGKPRKGVTIMDGRTRIAELVRCSDLIIATGTSLANGTYDEIAGLAAVEGKQLVLYGITAAGFCAMMGVERWCFRAGDGGKSNNVPINRNP